MNTFELELLDGWDERTITQLVTTFVRRERRFPDYHELLWMQSRTVGEECPSMRE